jgi:hypothetical protein
MSTVKSLDISMGVNLASFKKGLDQATGMMQGFATKINTGMQAGVAALAAYVGFKALKGLTVDAIEATYATDRMATRIGTSAGMLGKLRYAAAGTGTETEALDSGMMKLQRTLGVAATKGGPAAQSLKTMGLDAKALAAMDPGNAMLEIAKGFAKIQNPAQQAATAVQLFGRGGMEMLNMLRAGPEKIAAMMKEAGGLRMSITPEQREMIDQSHHAMERLTFATKAFGSVLAVNVAPAITSVINKFIGWATEGNRLTNALNQGSQLVVLAFQTLGDTYKLIGNLIGNSISKIYEWATGGKSAGDIVNGAFLTVKNTIIAVDTVINNSALAWDIVKLSAQQAALQIQADWSALVANVLNYTTWLGEGWSVYWTSAVEMAQGAWSVISSGFNSFVNFGKDCLTAIWTVWKDTFNMMLTIVKGVFGAIFYVLKEAAKQFAGMVPGLGQGFVDTFDSAYNAVAETIKGAKILTDDFMAKRPPLVLPVKIESLDLTAKMKEMSDKIKAAQDAAAKNTSLGSKPIDQGKSPAATMANAPPKFADMAIQGSKEAYSAIIRHNAGGGKDSSMDKLAGNSDRQVELMEKLVENTDDMDGGDYDPFSM